MEFQQMITMLGLLEIKLLACFFPRLETKTAKQIEQCAKYSHEPVFRVLKGLVRRGYLEETKVGKTNVYKFIRTDESLLVFVHYMTARIGRLKNRHSLTYKRLKEFADSVSANSVILFGSYAKGTETEDSDIDIIVVTNKKGVEKTASVFRTKYNMTIRPVVIRPADFRNIRKDNEVFYNDMVEYGVILSGQEYFFREVYR